MKVLLLFIDGLGLGSNSPEINPLVRFGLPSIDRLFGLPLTQDMEPIILADRCLVPIDATLGVEGLPQSATGQGALLTGLNTAQIMGRHIQAFPGPQLAKIITENNLMRKLAATGLTATSANLYLPNYLELVAKRKRRHSAITLAILSTGMPLRSMADMQQGLAVYQDITNEMIAAVSGIDTVPSISPTHAAQNLVNISRKYSFTIFEYFQTDRAGHKQNWQTAQSIVSILDNFIAAIIAFLPADTLFIITSDHGNFEDFSVKTHTVNRVPLIAVGVDSPKFIGGITDLTGIAPALIEVLRKDESHD